MTQGDASVATATDVDGADDSRRTDRATRMRTTFPEVDGAQSVSEAVALAVRELAGPDETLRPLYEAVDPEALDDLCDDSNGRAPTGYVEFTYGGFDVTVYVDGAIDVREPPTS